jgi:hypothetical protein
MAINLGEMFKSALRDERKVLRPYFFPAAQSTQLVTEETYLRLRLARMFLKYKRELFKNKYPVVNTLMRFAGLDGPVEVNFVVKPELAGGGDPTQLDDVAVMDQTLLGPILYRGGDLELMLGLYAAPADDWAQRFIKLAEGVSQLAINATLTMAVTMASTIKASIESAIGGNELDLKLGLDKELKENVWLAPGYIVMIAAPDESLDMSSLQVKDGELLTSAGRVYTDHDYIVLAIEVSNQRSDWQGLGYGRAWKELLKVAADANDVQQVKEAYTTFSGAIFASADLSWADRNAIVALAQQKVKTIRDARAGTGFLDNLKSATDLLQLEALVEEEPVLPPAGESVPTTAELLETNWIE